MNTYPSHPTIALRAMEPADVDRLYLWENDPGIWQFGGMRAPVSRHQLWEYADSYDANPFSSGQLRLVIDICHDDGKREPCGTADLYDIDPANSRAMVGIMVAPEFRGKGIAAGALEMLGDYCRDILGLSTLAADVPADNLPSMHLFGGKARYSLIGERPGWFRRGGSFVACAMFQKSLF